MILIPPDLQQTINNELEPGEDVLWQDMPVRQYFTPASTASFLFAIPWTAFALFWMWGASGFGEDTPDGPASFFFLFGLPFVLIGFGMLSAPLWAYWKSGKTAYVITGRRAITFEGGRSMTVRSYPPDKLQNVYRKEKKDGTGDVVIEVKALARLRQRQADREPRLSARTQPQAGRNDAQNPGRSRRPKLPANVKSGVMTCFPAETLRRRDEVFRWLKIRQTR